MKHKHVALPVALQKQYLLCTANTTLTYHYLKLILHLEVTPL